MARVRVEGARIGAVVTCVPERAFNNVTDTTEFTREEVRKVVGMAGVRSRRLAEEGVCSSDF